MNSKGVLQPDGTRCRKGATCKRHGSLSGNSWAHMKKQVPRPPNLSNYYDEELADLSAHLTEVGFTGVLKHPYWNDEAVTQCLGEVECSPDVSLLVRAPSMYYFHMNLPRNVLELWLVEKGETVGVLKIMAQKINQPITEVTPETIVSCIEIKPSYRGKGKAGELLRLAEEHVVSTRIHSGGHYTPEGEKFLAGKLPYTRQALAEKDWGGLGIGVHFNSMSFVDNWEKFYLK